jgi:hypothetical protein
VLRLVLVQFGEACGCDDPNPLATVRPEALGVRDVAQALELFMGLPGAAGGSKYTVCLVHSGELARFLGCHGSAFLGLSIGNDAERVRKALVGVLKFSRGVVCLERSAVWLAEHRTRPYAYLPPSPGFAFAFDGHAFPVGFYCELA